MVARHTPGEGQGHNTKETGRERATKSPKRSQGERQHARARGGTSPSEGTREEAKQEWQNEGPGQGQGQRERNKWKESQPGGKGKGKGGKVEGSRVQ